MSKIMNESIEALIRNGALSLAQLQDIKNAVREKTNKVKYTPEYKAQVSKLNHERYSKLMAHYKQCDYLVEKLLDSKTITIEQLRAVTVTPKMRASKYAYQA